MRIAITGGSGFVGKALTEFLVAQNHEVLVLTRNAKNHIPNVKFVEWLTNTSHPEKELNGVDAIINLAGQSINARWTPSQKKEIMESRIKSTKTIEAIINELSEKPKVVINASAIGVYGTTQDKEFTEESKDRGNDFLAQTVISWEQSATRIQQLGIRTVMARFGVILGKNEGALPKMVFPYKLFAGGKIGSGKQWVSWVHIDDVVRILYFILTHPDISGPINVTAPNPVTMNLFGQKIGKTLRRPHWLPVPSIALKVLLGEMSMLVLDGQKVIPKKLAQSGYPFIYHNLDDALNDLLL